MTDTDRRRPSRFGSNHALLDTSVAIVTDDIDLKVELDRLLASFASAGSDATVEYSIAAQGDELVLRRDGAEIHCAHPADMVPAVLAELNALAVDRYRGFAAHAGVVASRGRAICFPGISGLGKSTLAAACVLVGLDYVSDEALCLDGSTGQVVAYPRPIALSPASQALLGLAPRPRPGHRPGSPGDDQRRDGETYWTIDDLGGTACSAPTDLAHVIELVRHAGPPRLVPLDRVATVATLLAMSFNLHKAPDRHLDLIASAARRADAWRLLYDEPLPAAELLARRLA